MQARSCSRSSSNFAAATALYSEVYLASCVMSSAPPLAPGSDDHRTVYLVLDNFGGRMGRSWRETEDGQTDLASLMIDLVDGQYNDPVRVVAFNMAEGWARDASREIADLIAYGRERDSADVPPFLRNFVARHGSGRAVADGHQL
jgi:hypothetical protein